LGGCQFMGKRKKKFPRITSGGTERAGERKPATQFLERYLEKKDVYNKTLSGK